MKSLDLNSSEQASGCIAGIFRHVFFRNLRRSDRSSDVCEIEKDGKKPPPSPNLVARLMGLETMPIHPCTPKESFVRSRSTNSIHGFLCSEMSWGGKPRISQSFREVPTFLRRESEGFLVLSFTTPEVKTECSGKSKDGKSDVERQRVGGETVEVKNAERLRKEEWCREPRQRADAERHDKVKKQREDPRIPSSKSKKKGSSVRALQRVELECSSENSSPVSVLDRHLGIDGESSPVSEEDKKPKQAKPRRRKLSSPGSKCDNYPPTKNELIKSSKEEGIKSSNAKCNNKEKKLGKKQQQRASHAWSKICQMAEQDLRNPCWDFREIWRLDNNGEIATAFAREILDSLLCEIVTELSTCFVAM